MPKVALLMFVLCALFVSRANASAWMLDSGEVKAVVKHSQFRADPEVPEALVRFNPLLRRITGKVRASDSELFLEYGAAKNLTTTLKFIYRNEELMGDIYFENSNPLISGNSRRENETANSTYENELLEIAGRTPLKYNLGLLPPFTKKIVESIAKRVKIKERVRREKVGSFGVHFLYHGNSEEVGYGVSVSQGDKLSIGRWSILQEAQYQQIYFDSAEWRRSLYKAEIGYGSTYIGQEVDNFEDRKSDYKSKTEFYYVGYDVKTFPIAMRFGLGKERRPFTLPLGGTILIARNTEITLPEQVLIPLNVNMWRLEFQYKF